MHENFFDKFANTIIQFALPYSSCLICGDWGSFVRVRSDGSGQCEQCGASYQFDVQIEWKEAHDELYPSGVILHVRAHDVQDDKVIVMSIKISGLEVRNGESEKQS